MSWQVEDPHLCAFAQAAVNCGYDDENECYWIASYYAWDEWECDWVPYDDDDEWGDDEHAGYGQEWSG